MAPATSTFFGLLSLLALLHVRVHANPVPPPPGNYSNPGGCNELLRRHEWRALSTEHKADYINAIKCFQGLSAYKPVIAQAQSRFDEFQAYHITIADQVHLVGQFLPWHRNFVRIYEQALRNECGYQGATPYWDWSQDSEAGKSLADSPIFDPETGFGGDGVPGTYTLPPDPTGTSRFYFPQSFVGCVPNGPFANYTLHLGPGKLITDHCLVRGINDTYQQFLSISAVANDTKLPNFEEFRIELEGEPVTPTHKMHDSGHIGTGGEMSNFYSSPGDPLFYLHHANLDRIWWNWQQMLPSRLYEVTGRSTVNPPYTNITLDFPLNMGELGPTIPIREIMDIHSAPACYTYV